VQKEAEDAGSDYGRYGREADGMTAGDLVQSIMREGGAKAGKNLQGYVKGLCCEETDWNGSSSGKRERLFPVILVQNTLMKIGKHIFSSFLDGAPKECRHGIKIWRHKIKKHKNPLRNVTRTMNPVRTCP